ncbi:hypothetical protein D3C87_1923660 [compost metagenome]
MALRLLKHSKKKLLKKEPSVLPVLPPQRFDKPKIVRIWLYEFVKILASLFV